LLYANYAAGFDKVDYDIPIKKRFNNELNCCYPDIHQAETKITIIPNFLLKKSKIVGRVKFFHSLNPTNFATL